MCYPQTLSIEAKCPVQFSTKADAPAICSTAHYCTCKLMVPASGGENQNGHYVLVKIDGQFAECCHSKK